jgi:hypothetical protein
MNVVSGGRNLTAALLVVAGLIPSACGGDGPDSPVQPTVSSQSACRTYPAQYQTITSSGSSSSTAVTGCRFDKSSATMTCSSDGATPTTRVYRSVADFVDEVMFVGRVLATSEARSSSSFVSESTAFTYDDQRRLTQWVSQNVGGKYASRKTCVATSWDERGRPVSVSATFELTGSARPIDYSGPITCAVTQSFDDNARTLTRSVCPQVQEGATETFDQALFMANAAYTSTTGYTWTITNTVLSTFSVCK